MRKVMRAFLGGGLLLLLLSIVALSVGPVDVSLSEITRGATWELTERSASSIALAQESPEAFYERYGFVYTHWVIVRDVRLPRMLWALLVGAVLACSGVGMQSLFRNPLADPGLIGVSAGASLGAIVALVCVPSVLGALTLPLGAFMGSMLAVIFIYKMAHNTEQPWAGSLLLVGVAVNAFVLACVGGLIYFSQDAQLRDYTFWALGSLNKASWDKVSLSAPFMLLPLVIFPWLGGRLNAVLLGEEQAGYLGVNVATVRRWVILLSASMVGCAVAFCGIIGFVGLIVPHAVRLVLGPDNRRLIPAAMLLGAILLLSADLGIRALPGGVEMPIGVVTAFVGAPVFLILLRRQPC